MKTQLDLVKGFRVRCWFYGGALILLSIITLFEVFSGESWWWLLLVVGLSVLGVHTIYSAHKEVSKIEYLEKEIRWLVPKRVKK